MTPNVAACAACLLLAACSQGVPPPREPDARPPAPTPAPPQPAAAVASPPPADKSGPAYAHYKRAYVHFNRGDSAGALDEMTKAIEASEAQTRPDLSQLAKEARRDLIPIYAAAGDPSRAYDFLAARSGDRPGRSERLDAMLDALGKSYVDCGRPDAALELHLDWLSRGAGPQTCAVVKQIDAVLAHVAAMPQQRARVQWTAAASAPLMKARLQCDSASLRPL